MDLLLFSTRLSIIACRHMVPFYYKGETVNIPEMAERYGFKARSLNLSFTKLTKAGILRSRVGGKHEDRGFFFAKDPKNITLYDIVIALEGEETFECCGNKLNCNPIQCKDCSIHSELYKIIDYRKKLLSSTTIYEHYNNISK